MTNINPDSSYLINEKKGYITVQLKCIKRNNRVFTRTFAATIKTLWNLDLHETKASGSSCIKINTSQER